MVAPDLPNYGKSWICFNSQPVKTLVHQRSSVTVENLKRTRDLPTGDCGIMSELEVKRRRENHHTNNSGFSLKMLQITLFFVIGHSEPATDPPDEN